MNVFDKTIKPNWSQELYKVEAVRGNRVKLQDGNELLDHQVQVINPDLLMNNQKIKVVTQEEKQIKKRERDMGKEMRQLADFNKAPDGTQWIKEGKRQRKRTKAFDI
jgi:hypothetical protein